ncbi:M56 family metallopeptidase [Prosthecobacter sp.]|uniref:M56 family metallopeptidase n=1 Tax=Prosthecobacter sp. TaxID=1965333 RepID=UPI002AB98D39|nr:M56 family metallopeptidase [Prosthecobacter sp.]MDZ4402674.1 M56 family metallopeptidase [Prosthecobacter sp.]
MSTDALLHWLLRTSLEASILILAVLGLRLMLGTRLSPAWRIGLWMLVGMKLMLPAFIPAGFGLGGWLQAEEVVQTVSSTNIIAPVHGSESVFPTDSENPQMNASESIGGFSESAGILSGNLILLAIWLTGAASVILAALLRQRLFDAVLRRRPRATSPYLRALVASLAQKAGVKMPVSILLMPGGTTPAMVGVRRPKLLLPEDWESRFDDRSLRHVVLHELLHVKQRDLLWNWAAIAVQALHWFNPLVWFVVSRFQADRELRCDAGALALLSPAERLDYGHTLLRIQETFFAPPAIAGLAPCVRNHPTLRQRILMITHPTTRQPWLHALLVLTLSVLVCYSFTTARAQEKEVPPKVREGETLKKTAASGDSETPGKKPATREGEGGMKKTGDGEREGGKPSAERDGGTKKPGARDGEGGVKKPGTGDGEGTKKPGARDGEGGVKKPGSGDGEGSRKPGMKDGEKPRTGERDGEKPRTGERDGEKPRTGSRDGEGGTKTRKGEGDSASVKSSEVITMHVAASGDTVLINGEKQPLSGIRGHLSTFLPDHPGAKVVVSGDPDTPLKSLHEIVDAVRDNGNKNVGIKTE